MISFHHAHPMASGIDATIAFWRDQLYAQPSRHQGAALKATDYFASVTGPRLGK